MPAAFVFAVLLTCAGDPVPATVSMPLPPPQTQLTEKVADHCRARPDARTRFLLEVLVTALKVAAER